MSGSKYIEKIAWVVTALTLTVAILFMNGASLGMEAAHTMGYEERLFDATNVHTIDIVMDDWDEFIANASSEEYYAANVVIDGESYKNVGIRAKGNTSLTTVSALGSERYSFKIEFDQYDSSKSYHGLDKMSLNNLIQDSTMMKDYLSYTMMNAFGVNASLCSFVYITVNGEDWGLYLAVEGVEEAFLERNYGSDYGELYKPDSISLGGGRGNGQDFDFSDGETDFSDAPEDVDPSEVFGQGEESGFRFGGFEMGSSDVKLQYIDDDLDSYSNIWESAKTDITETDKKRLVQSLKKLSDMEEIESIVDVDQVIRYFVVHNYICNDDSYTGTMVHNYYLYEKDGQMAMIPWDYNLGFGTFRASDATSTVNTPIDTPVTGGSSDRPMLNWIFEDEAYTEQYHQYFAQFLETVDIAGIIDDAYQLIKSYVEKDPTAFYTYEEFELGVETLRQFCEMRSESISKQLEEGETTNNMEYVDASSITLSDMGSMEGGMGGFGGDVPDMPNMPERSDMPDDMDTSAGEAAGGGSQMPPDTEFSAEDLPPDGEKNFSFGGGMQMPDGGVSSGFGGAGTGSDYVSGWIGIAVSAVILAAGLLVAKKYGG